MLHEPGHLSHLKIAAAICNAIGSPLATKLLTAVEVGDWREVLSIDVNPRDYRSASSYYSDAVLTLFKKCVDLPLEVDRLTPTVEKWLASEHACYRANIRLSNFRPGCFQHSDEDWAIARHIDGVRKIIKSMIGGGPSEVNLELGFSPGSTYSDRKQEATIGHKLSATPTTTRRFDAAGYPGFIGTMWHHLMVDGGLVPDIVRGGEFFTVPKTALIERPAELQPSLLVSRQLALGRAIKRELKSRTGWDISKAQEIHGELARISSVSREYFTMDLSSASDCISRTLVEVLLPPRWFRKLSECRTELVEKVPVGKKTPQGTKVASFVLEKFSSMGNGFTFELETVIFAAVLCYVSRLNGFAGQLGVDCFAYGDDLIARDELFGDVKAFLGFLGFTVNAKKSFFGDDPFRESCGADYFLGSNVRPFSFERAPDGIQALVTLANQVQTARERFSAFSLDDPLRGLWYTCLSHLPRWIRDCRGPSWLGDNVIQDPNRANWITRRDSGRIMIKCHQHLPMDSSWVPWGVFDAQTRLACAVLGFGSSERGLLPRDPELELHTAWVVLECTSTGE